MTRLAIVLALASGCSFVLVDRAPKKVEPGATPACTDELTLPLIDAVATILLGAGGVTLLAAANDDDGGDDSLRGVGIASVSLAGVFVVSAGYGAWQRRRCQRARAEALGPAKGPRTDEPPPGRLGGRCKSDGTCDGTLICDQPMRTCIPIGDEDIHTDTDDD